MHHRSFVLIFCVLFFSAATSSLSSYAQTPFSAPLPSGWVVPQTSTAEEDAYRLSAQGVALATAGRYDEAVVLLEKASRAMPNSSTIWLNLSLAYDQLERTADSLAAARRAVELDTSDREARMHLCDVTTYSKLFSEGYACYLELERSGPLDDRVMSNFAMAAIGAGELVKAQSILEPICIRQPRNGELLNALGVVTFKRRNLPEAIAYFKRAIEAEPDRGLFRFNMAMAQMQSKNRVAAISQFNVLRVSDPGLAADLGRLIFGDKLFFVRQK